MVTHVAGNSRIDLVVPEFSIGGRAIRPSTVRVTVPKAPVYEDNFSMAWKDYIRAAGQIFAVQTEAITPAVQKASHASFRLRIAAFHLRHVAAARFGGKVIGHYLKGRAESLARRGRHRGICCTTRADLL